MAASRRAGGWRARGCGTRLQGPARQVSMEFSFPQYKPSIHVTSLVSLRFIIICIVKNAPLRWKLSYNHMLRTSNKIIIPGHILENAHGPTMIGLPSKAATAVGVEKSSENCVTDSG